MSLLSLLLVHQPVSQTTRFGIGIASGPRGWTACAKGIPVTPGVLCMTPGLRGDSVGSGAWVCVILVPAEQQGH